MAMFFCVVQTPRLCDFDAMKLTLVFTSRRDELRDTNHVLVTDFFLFMTASASCALVRASGPMDLL